MTSFIESALIAQYGLQAPSLKKVPGGWSADAYTARTPAGGFFVKAYDKHRQSIQQWIHRIGAYMPVVLWLDAHTPLHGRISAPVFTKDGAYKVENADHLLMVFPLIEGETLGGTPPGPAQVRQLADILACLHAYGNEIPAHTQSLRETYDLPFLGMLRSVLAGKNVPPELKNTLRPYHGTILRAMDTVQALADAVQAENPRMVLCHTDVHGWNLMWDGASLTLIDWEGLRLAPAEADLFAFTDGFFFDDAKDAFFAAYSAARGGYAENTTAVAFYRLRRRLEDIADFAESITSDGLSPGENSRSLRYLEKECRRLDEK